MSTPMLCRYCGNIFKSKSTLRQHELRHKAEGPYKCKECKMVAFSSSNFERHLRSHTTEKPFDCKKCGKSFKGKKDLKRIKIVKIATKNTHVIVVIMYLR